MPLTYRLRALVLSFLSLILCATGTSASPPPTSTEYGVVLNLSGKQRMLTQKMSKEALLIALDLDAQNNLAQLNATIGLFDKTMSGLRNGSDELGLPATQSRRILRQLDKVDAIWSELYPVMQEIIKTKVVTKAHIQVVAEKNGPLLKAMNKAVGLYEKEAKKGGLESAPELATAINLSGKQRMLTQKISKEFLLIAYGHQVEDNRLNLIETSSLFERTLNGLQNGDDVLGLPGTDVEPIRNQLQLVAGLWKEFKPLISNATDSSTVKLSKEQCSILAQANLPLLKEMNKAVGLFEAQAT